MPSVNYNTFSSIPGDCLSNTNIISRIPRFKFNETVFDFYKLVGPSGWNPMLRAERNSFDATHNVVRIFAPSRKAVLNPCFWTGSTA